MPFTLPDLPYPKDALGDVMSAETFDYHHGKHHKAYVDKANGMLAEKGLEGAKLSDNAGTALSEITRSKTVFSIAWRKSSPVVAVRISQSHSGVSKAKWIRSASF